MSEISLAISVADLRKVYGDKAAVDGLSLTCRAAQKALPSRDRRKRLAPLFQDKP